MMTMYVDIKHIHNNHSNKTDWESPALIREAREMTRSAEELLLAPEQTLPRACVGAGGGGGGVRGLGFGVWGLGFRV